MPRRGALGLRGRIVGAVIVTTVATLLVAALALLGPLENKLRTAEYNAFKRQLDRGAAAQIAAIPHLDDAYLAKQPKPARPPKGAGTEQSEQYAKDLQTYNYGGIARKDLLDALVTLEDRTTASDVSLWGYSPDPGQFGVIAAVPNDASVAPDETYGATYLLAYGSYIDHKLGPRYERRTIGGTEYAVAAVPFTTLEPAGTPGATLGANHLKTPSAIPAPAWVLVARRPFAEVSDAVRVVRTAFLDAALAGLALTLVLAIPLSFTLVRRLRRLRQAALQLAEGRSGFDFRVDRARDEVGDLARTFKIMQAQLRQQEEARRAFVATASHELRTPLTSLDGMLELLDDDLRSGDVDLAESRALLERARMQSRRLGRLAADLLDLSRIDAQVTLRSEPVELSELSRAVLAEFELGTSARGI